MITLAQSETIIDAILARGRALGRRPLAAVGVTGDTQERDEEPCAHGIREAGLKTDDDCADLGAEVRLEN